MTEQEFDNLEWQFGSHFNTPTRYSKVDRCKTMPTLYRCTTVNYKNGMPTNWGGYIHYVLNDKMYNSKQKLLEDINND